MPKNAIYTFMKENMCWWNLNGWGWVTKPRASATTILKPTLDGVEAPMYRKNFQSCCPQITYGWELWHKNYGLHISQYSHEYYYKDGPLKHILTFYYFWTITNFASFLSWFDRNLIFLYIKKLTKFWIGLCNVF